MSWIENFINISSKILNWLDQLTLEPCPLLSNTLQSSECGSSSYDVGGKSDQHHFTSVLWTVEEKYDGFKSNFKTKNMTINNVISWRSKAKGYNYSSRRFEWHDARTEIESSFAFREEVELIYPGAENPPTWIHCDNFSDPGILGNLEPTIEDDSMESMDDSTNSEFVVSFASDSTSTSHNRGDDLDLNDTNLKSFTNNIFNFLEPTIYGDSMEPLNNEVTFASLLPSNTKSILLWTSCGTSSTFKIHIARLLKETQPNNSLSRQAAKELDLLVMEMLDMIAQYASLLVQHENKKTLTERHLEMAVRKLMTPVLAMMATTHGQNAVWLYNGGDRDFLQTF